MGIIFTIKDFIARRVLRRSTISMWKKRARLYGQRAVLHIGHSEQEVEIVTKMQKDVILPYFRQELNGREKLVLDLGCGPGRFTPDLADAIRGQAIGMDPISDFLRMAPRCANVDYRLLKSNKIPLQDQSVDVVWICLVLGGLVDEDQLGALLREVNRVLTNDGLVFLVENTSEKKDGDYWKFRSVNHYRTLFSFAAVRHLHDYYDLGERISLMAGRKIPK